MQIIIPAYNEAKRLPRTLEVLRQRAREVTRVVGRIEVLVVDNASTDTTADVARAHDSLGLRVRVLHCAVPGKGAAVRAGMLASTHDLVVFMDADGATDLDALLDGWRLMARGADIAVGSRAMLGAETHERHTWARAKGASLFRFFGRGLVPGISDSQCGFKMMRGDLARTLAGRQVATGFSFDVELLARALRSGARVEEYPVRWTDVPGSTFSAARHGAGAFVELAQIARRLRHEVPTSLNAPVSTGAGIRGHVTAVSA